MNQPDIERIEAWSIVHLNEDLDAANAAAVQRRLAEALGPDSLTLVIDLGCTHYVDSAGIDMLLRLADLLDQRRAKLCLVIPESSPLRRLFTIVGLPEAITIHPTVADALSGTAWGRAARHPPLAPSTPPRPHTRPGIQSGHVDAVAHPWLRAQADPRSGEVSSFELTSRSKGDGVVIGVTGELDLAMADRLQSAIDAVGAPVLVIDLSGCEFLDSTGIAVIVRAHSRFAEERRRLFITSPQRPVLRVLELTGLDADGILVGGSDEVLG